MRRELVVIAVVSVLAGCGKGTVAWDGSIFGEGPFGGGAGGFGGGAGGGTGGGLPAVLADLPCDVAQVLTSSCADCHGPTSNQGLVRLATRSDLVALSPADTTHTVAQRAVVRMTQTVGEMPPAPRPVVPATGVAAFQTWISGGMSAGSCTVAPGDGGVVSPPDAGSWDGGLAGLPCDVAAMVASRCASCHAPGGPNVPLVSLANFLAPSPTTPSITVAASAVQRLASATSPMPPVPNPRPTSAELSAFDAWVAAGTPSGTCGSVDAGVSDGGLYQTTCASGIYWTLGNKESEDMNPGMACLACHLIRANEPEKLYTFSGTVFPSQHEKDLCTDALPGPAKVEIHDADGGVFTLSPSAVSGNFHSRSGLVVALPYTARVYRGVAYAEMTTPQTVGDCNTCHSEQGANQAYGRIVQPP